MLDLKEVTIRNYLSYGDEDNRLPLADMQQVFVTGQIIDPDGSSDTDRSNASGKSSLLQSILWILFGKHMYSSNPGKKVLNWHTKGDTEGTLRFKNGDSITRIRRRGGETELIYEKSGNDYINTTLSTTPNMQELLSRQLQLDYEVFCGSVFSSQYKKSWMEMSDQVRKKSLERVMGVDRLTIYAEVAKSQRDAVELERNRIQATIDANKITLGSLREQLETNEGLRSGFESGRDDRTREKQEEATEAKRKANNITTHKLEALQRQWGIVQKVEIKITEMRIRVDELQGNIDSLRSNMTMAERPLNTQIAALAKKLTVDLQLIDTNHNTNIEQALQSRDAELDTISSRAESQVATWQGKKNELTKKLSSKQGDLQSISGRIQSWEGKSGTTCIECEQEVPSSHTCTKADPLREEVKELDTTISKIVVAIDATAAKINNLNESKTADQLAVRDKHKQLVDELNTKRVNDREAAEKENAEATEALDKELEALKKESREGIAQQEKQLATLKESIRSTESKLEERRPTVTLEAATAQQAQRQTLLEQAAGAIKEAENIAGEANPYLSVIDALKSKIDGVEAILKKEQNRADQHDLTYIHLNYIYKAYSDRRKIKSFMIGKHRPYFNSRLNHYMDAFDLSVRVVITDSLGLDSNKWGWDHQSGGQRQRTDLCFMFAVFDMHSHLHGPQCNVLVLDEPDEALDGAGVRSLINIIREDLAHRFETIFVISHKDKLKNVFPHSVHVEMQDDISRIAEIR